MNIAGVALPDGRLLWARTGITVSVLDDVILRVDEEEIEGTVVVAPDQLLRPPGMAPAEVVQIVEREMRQASCDDLPGADLPPLGSRISVGEVVGRITGLDPVGRTVTVTSADESAPVQVAVSELASEKPILDTADPDEESP